MTLPHASDNPLSIDDIARLVCRGGRPQTSNLSDLSDEEAIEFIDASLERILHVELSRIEGVRRSSERAYAILSAYAAHVGEEATFTELAHRAAKDAVVGVPLGPRVLSTYVKALTRLGLLADAPAWVPVLRTKVPVRKSSVRYFVDPSIAAALLGRRPRELAESCRKTPPKDPTFARLFANLCMRDLRLYSGASGGTVRRYRDASGLTCDAVVLHPDGRFGLVAVQLDGSVGVEVRAERLKALAAKIAGGPAALKPAPNLARKPAFSMILTGTGAFSYGQDRQHQQHLREEGVLVVPIGCLGP